MNVLQFFLKKQLIHQVIAPISGLANKFHMLMYINLIANQN